MFLGVLAAATVFVLAFYGKAISAWTPPSPRTDIVTAQHFVSMRGVENEVDLGKGWRATDDPGAAWHVWWIPASGELVGLRTSYLPPPPGPAYMGPAFGRSVLDPHGVNQFTGMRVLGTTGSRPSKSACDMMRPLPDGLDVLCGGTHNTTGLTNEER